MFRGPARINRDGRFSVHVESREQHWSRRIKPELKLQLRSDAAVIRSLVNDPHSSPFSRIDVRNKLSKMHGAVGNLERQERVITLLGSLNFSVTFGLQPHFASAVFGGSCSAGWQDIAQKMRGIEGKA